MPAGLTPIDATVYFNLTLASHVIHSAYALLATGDGISITLPLWSFIPTSYTSHGTGLRGFDWAQVVLIKNFASTSTLSHFIQMFFVATATQASNVVEPHHAPQVGLGAE